MSALDIALGFVLKEGLLLAVLVFWQRMEWQHHNGRRRSRSFIESLYGVLPPPAEDGNLVQG